MNGVKKSITMIVPFLVFVLVSGGFKIMNQIKVDKADKERAAKYEEQKDTISALNALSDSLEEKKQQYKEEFGKIEFPHLSEYTEEESLKVITQKMMINYDIEQKSFKNIEQSLQELRALRDEIEARFN